MRTLMVSSRAMTRKQLARPGSGVFCPKVVSFSGIDGAGKSTQIEALCASMRAAGVRFRVIRFWDEVATFVGCRETASVGVFKSDPGVGSPEAPVNRRDKNVRSWYMTCIRLVLYFADALSLRAVTKKSKRSDYDVILFDRFIYDELANLNMNNPALRIYCRFLLALAPKPDISYLLDADPVQARARKPEYPIEFIYSNREAYLKLSRFIQGVVIIRPMSIEEAKREIIKHGAELVSGKDREYVA